MSMEDRLDALTAEVREVRTAQHEIRASVAETRTSVTEVRSALAEFRLDITSRLDGLGSRMDTLIGAIADLRQEYHGHTHEG